MKKIFTKLMLLAVAATAIVSCENNYEEQTPVVELTQTVTLSADKTAVRTELIEGVPYWSKGDQIGVYVVEGESYKNYAFKNDNEEATLTTSFTGETAVANTLFVYYPYTNFNDPVTEKGVKVEILANQEPTAASFDGRTDLMIAKPVTLDAEGNQLSDLEFARVAAIVKVVLKDKTGNLAGQHVSSLTMTAATNLVGRVYLDVVNQKINSEEGLYYGKASSVTATYTEATQYEVNGTNATYVVVYPQTLTAGSKLTIEASTEGYAISKEITLPSDIELLAGKVTTLNVSLAAENVVAEATGLALPFKDDFARVAYDSGEGGIDLSVLGENYSAMEKVYKAKVGNGGILKLGTGSAEGYFTTTALDLSKPFTVFVEAQRYGTSTSDKLQITVGSQVLTSTNLTADSKYYVFEFEAASKKEQVEIRTIKRAYINDLQIVEGHGLDVPTLPAVLTVSPAEISGVSHEGEAKTFTYSVANPVEGTSVVITADAEWLTIADNNGTVTVTVAENTLEEERNATITVKYGDLTETIAIQQNAKPAEGGETGGTVVDVLNRTLTGITKNSTSYSNWSGKTSNSTAVYAGNSAGGNDAIQLRSDNSNSGIVTTASGGKVAKIVVTWQSATKAGRILDIYGKNTAYSAATDLYDSSKQGTKLGSIEYGTSTTLTIEGDYQYIGLRSKSGAMYLEEIQITWESGSSDDGNTGGEGGETPDPTPDPEEPETPGTGGGETQPVTVTKDSFSAASGSLDGVISYSCAKGGGTSNPFITTNNTIRLYQPASGKTEGGNITITATDGYTITSVVIGSKQGTQVSYQLDGGSKSSAASLSADDKYTITANGAQSVTVHCMGTSSSSRLEVNYLSVTYK